LAAYNETPCMEIKISLCQKQLSIVDENAQAPFDAVPKAPKPGYKVTPNMVALARMSLKELEEVNNFKVENEHGSVEWPGKTDLTGVDLADTITIRSKEAEVYADEHSKPAHGQRLNKTAIITLNDFKPKKSQTATQMEKALKTALETK